MNNRASLEKSQVYFGWKLQWQNQWQVNEHGRSAYPFLSNINLTHPMSWVSRERCHKEDCGHCCSVPDIRLAQQAFWAHPLDQRKLLNPFSNTRERTRLPYLLLLRLNEREENEFTMHIIHMSRHNHSELTAAPKTMTRMYSNEWRTSLTSSNQCKVPLFCKTNHKREH